MILHIKGINLHLTCTYVTHTYVYLHAQQWKDAWVASIFGLLLGVQMFGYQLRLQVRSTVIWRESLGTFLRHRNCNPNQHVFNMPIGILAASLIGKNCMASHFRGKDAQRKTEKAFLGWRHNSVLEPYTILVPTKCFSQLEFPCSSFIWAGLKCTFTGNRCQAK